MKFKVKSICASIIILITFISTCIYVNLLLNKDYIVSFEAFDKIIYKENVKINGYIVEFIAPEYDGYEFVGWYYNDEKFNFNEKVKSDITLIAKYKPVNDDVIEEKDEEILPENSNNYVDDIEVNSINTSNEITKKNENNKVKEELKIIDNNLVIYYGKDYQEQKKINYKEKNINNRLIWKSSDENVVMVDKDGIVTAKAAGSAIITVITEDKKHSSSISVEVKPILPTEIKLRYDSADVYCTEGATIIAEVSPNNSLDSDVVWSSSNTKIATVEDGVVSCKNLGSVTITATTANGVSSSVDLNIKTEWFIVILKASNSNAYYATITAKGNCVNSRKQYAIELGGHRSYIIGSNYTILSESVALGHKTGTILNEDYGKIENVPVVYR